MVLPLTVHGRYSQICELRLWPYKNNFPQYNLVYCREKSTASSANSLVPTPWLGWLLVLPRTNMILQSTSVLLGTSLAPGYLMISPVSSLSLQSAPLWETTYLPTCATKYWDCTVKGKGRDTILEFKTLDFSDDQPVYEGNSEKIYDQVNLVMWLTSVVGDNVTTMSQPPIHPDQRDPDLQERNIAIVLWKSIVVW